MILRGFLAMPGRFRERQSWAKGEIYAGLRIRGSVVPFERMKYPSIGMYRVRGGFFDFQAV
jgi:hypothetical protein